MLNEFFYILIFALVMATYVSIVLQMLLGQYRPSFFSRGAWHWYIYLTATIVTIIASPQKTVQALLFPLYFLFFESLMIGLVNRRKLRKLL